MTVNNSNSDKIEPIEARAARKTPHTKYVLGISVVAALVLLLFVLGVFAA